MNEADIPIDIHSGKLQEWLISRRIVPKNTQTQIRDIRNKIANAVKDMPAHDDLIKLLSGAHINYFHCKQIVEILKQTEKDTRSVFGSYGSQRMKDWQEIIKLYEKDNVYLGEAAQILVRNITYEINGLKRQMTKLQQQGEESVKKIHDLDKTENILNAEHEVLCQKLGIKGENLNAELREKLQELPKIYEDSIKNVGTLDEAINIYGNFIENSQCLPLLRHIIRFGNTTVYEYIHKEAPVSIEEPPLNVNLTSLENVKDVQENDEINFDLDLEDGSGVAIDFGNLEDDGIQLETGDIDWGEPETAGESIMETNVEEYGIVVEGGGIDGGVAKGDQAFTILDSPNYREKFIDELYELESFLKLRAIELSTLENSNNILYAFMDNLSTHDDETVKKLLKNVTILLSTLMSEQTQHFFHLKHSPNYATILAGKLQQKLIAVERLKKTQEILRKKSTEFDENRRELEPLLGKMIEQTKILQSEIEKDISKRYKNRIVNLMGGVASL